MIRVKEEIDIIINEKLYCILNVHNDGYNINWLSIGIKVKDRYVNLWTQIANEFKDYNEYLIFESMDAVFFLNYTTFDFDYTTLTLITIKKLPNNISYFFMDNIRHFLNFHN